MFDITTAPKEELLQDLADTLVDIKFCQLALIHGVETYFDGHASTRERLEINERIREKIHAELERREQAAYRVQSWLDTRRTSRRSN